MSIAINWAPSVGAYAGSLSQSASAQQYAEMMAPFAQQYSAQSFESQQAKLQRELQASEAAKQRQLQLTLGRESNQLQAAQAALGFMTHNPYTNYRPMSPEGQQRAMAEHYGNLFAAAGLPFWSGGYTNLA